MITSDDIKLHIDLMERIITNLAPAKNREIALAITKLQEAQHWLKAAIVSTSEDVQK